MTTQQQDYERYERMGKLMCSEQVDSPQFQYLWSEREAIKNKYGGMPPKVVKEDGK